MKILSKDYVCPTPVTGMCWPQQYVQGAVTIVTANLRDFPPERLAIFGIEALSPDAFICDLFDLNRALTLKAIENACVSLNKPPLRQVSTSPVYSCQG